MNPETTITETAESVGKINSISGRFGELEKMGLIKVTGTKLIGATRHNGYSVTGRTVPFDIGTRENELKRAEKLETQAAIKWGQARRIRNKWGSPMPNQMDFFR